jgi:hypothetical protein
MTAEKSKKKRKAKDLRTPEEKWETLMSRLQLHNGCWAIQTEDELYVFPQYITKSEAIKVLRIAHDYNNTKSN